MWTTTSLQRNATDRQRALRESDRPSRVRRARAVGTGDTTDRREPRETQWLEGAPRPHSRRKKHSQKHLDGAKQLPQLQPRQNIMQTFDGTGETMGSVAKALYQKLSGRQKGGTVPTFRDEPVLAKRGRNVGAFVPGVARGGHKNDEWRCNTYLWISKLSHYL